MPSLFYFSSTVTNTSSHSNVFTSVLTQVTTLVTTPSAICSSLPSISTAATTTSFLLQLFLLPQLLLRINRFCCDRLRSFA